MHRGPIERPIERPQLRRRKVSMARAGVHYADRGELQRDVASPSASMASESGRESFAWAMSASSTCSIETTAIASDGRGGGLATGSFRGDTYWAQHGDIGHVYDHWNATENGGFVARTTLLGKIDWMFRFGRHSTNDTYRCNEGDPLVAAGSAIAPDGAEGGYVTGYFQRDARFGHLAHVPNHGGDDMFVMRVDGAGAPVWAVGAGGPGRDSGCGLVPDGRGGVLVMGAFVGKATFGTTTLRSSPDCALGE